MFESVCRQKALHLMGAPNTIMDNEPHCLVNKFTPSPCFGVKAFFFSTKKRLLNVHFDCENDVYFSQIYFLLLDINFGNAYMHVLVIRFIRNS